MRYNRKFNLSVHMDRSRNWRLCSQVSPAVENIHWRSKWSKKMRTVEKPFACGGWMIGILMVVFLLYYHELPPKPVIYSLDLYLLVAQVKVVSLILAQGFSTLSMHENRLESLSNQTAPRPIVSDSADLGWGPGVCRCPGGADAAGLGTRLWNHVWAT